MNIPTYKNRIVAVAGGSGLISLFVTEELLSRNAPVIVIHDFSKSLHSSIESFKAGIGLRGGNLESAARMRSGYVALFDRMLVGSQQLVSSRGLWRAPLVAQRNMVLM
jgi:hypothetical protein